MNITTASKNGKLYKVSLLIDDDSGIKAQKIEVQLGPSATRTDAIEAVNRLAGYWHSRLEILSITEVIA